MADVMMALGDYRFSIDTAALQNIQEVHAWRWSDHNLAGRKPRSQFIGADLSTLRFKGTIYPHFRGGLGQTDKMKAEGDRGKPLRMIDGLGKDLGLWTIRSLEVDKSQLFTKGVARKIEFNIELKEYPDKA
ncbi:phage tail protein [Vibrio cholerae]|uniref:phage tail protein n=1 Tax=Vibrio cholerae TaxID=666 RepID=UPI001D4A57F4|nr:phage tail protein [Vibrio cholerae]EHR7681839.1 phage tail protein [Vibrio cholerae]EHT2842187.1 phage tail protein [Vibrio cholerae]EIC9868186.1 phage tail protein [Vibrio cholerae]EII5611453.1 phage tail protein [Vibrio cholerae]EJE8131058.1 phage tail protein [Vibrio cholerae]